MVYPSRRVVLVDPQLISREGTVALMHADSSLEVLGSCASGHHAIAMCAESKPDVVIVDSEVSDPPLSETVAQLRLATVSPEIVVLATSADEQLLRSVFESGASACVVRDAGYARLRDAIHAATSGEVLIDVFRAQDFANQYPQSPDPSVLSARETEVLRHISAGMSTRDIAALLKISPKTVETHRAHIYRKLNKRTVVEIARYALLHGFTDSAEVESH